MKIYIYTLSFTNSRIINGCELLFFFKDFQSPMRAILFTDAA